MAGLFGIRDASELTFRDLRTGQVIHWVDTANSFNIDIKSDTVFAKKRGQKAIEWMKGKEGSIKAEFEVIDSRLLAMFLGAGILQGDSIQGSREELTVVNGKVTLKEVPVENSVSAFYLLSDEYSNGNMLNPVINGKELTFNGVADGIKVVVFSMYKVKDVTVFRVKSDEQPKAYILECFTTRKYEATHEEVPVFLHIPTVQLKASTGVHFDTANPSKFTLEMNIIPHHKTRDILFMIDCYKLPKVMTDYTFLNNVVAETVANAHQNDFTSTPQSTHLTQKNAGVEVETQTDSAVTGVVGGVTPAKPNVTTTQSGGTSVVTKPVISSGSSISAGTNITTQGKPANSTGK